jgi:hypothetical protein
MDRKDVEEACNRWRATSFPKGSLDDELDELHAQLAYVDAMIADSAIPFLAGSRYDPIPAQASDELEHVLSRASTLAQLSNPEISNTALEYRQYAALLRDVNEGLKVMAEDG